MTTRSLPNILTEEATRLGLPGRVMYHQPLGSFRLYWRDGDTGPDHWSHLGFTGGEARHEMWRRAEEGGFSPRITERMVADAERDIYEGGVDDADMRWAAEIVKIGPGGITPRHPHAIADAQSPCRDEHGEPIPTDDDGIPTRLPYITGETLTDEEIRDFRSAASAGGDLEQVAICTLALGDTDASTPDAEPGTPWAIVLEDFGLPASGMSETVPAEVRADAREECARAIARMMD